MPKIPLSGCLFTVLAFSCHLQVCVSECVPTVFAKRKNLYVPEGGSVSLWCDVQHCQQNWTGGWGISQRLFTFLTSSQRVHLSSDAIAVGSTRLFLNIHNLNQSDSGTYQCNINWKEINSQGHVIQVNVTAAVPEPTGRKRSYRLLVCAAASLSFPLVLILACCFSSDRQPPPPVPPPRSQNSSTARVKPRADVVYAALALNHPRQQSSAEAAKATTAVVYSTVSFSTA